MKSQSRLTAAALVLAIVISGSASSACTTMRPITLANGPSASPFTGIKAGDTVDIRLHDGRRERFVVASIEGETLISSAGVRYARAEMIEIRKRSISPVRTTLLVVAVSAGAVLAIAAIAWSTWDGPVFSS